MNRSKKEKERLRKRQNRIQQNQQHTAKVSAGTTHPAPSTLPTTRQQVPSCSSPTVTLHGIQQTPTQDPWCSPRLPQSTQQTQCQLDGPQIRCRIADTTSQIVNMVGDENTEMTDDVIEAMLNLMNAFSNDHNISIGFFTPAEIRLYSSDPTSYIRKIPMNRDCLLVHPLTGHWVTSVYRKDSNTVTVYDSMRTENHYYEIRNQIRVLYGNDIASRLQYVPVQQQNHMPICGGMALAFATTIFHATDPRTFNYDISKIRGHIRACLSNGIIQQFPLLPTLSTPLMSSVRNTPSVSSVRMRTLSTPSVSSVRQKTWTPLLENYFDEQNHFDQMHRTNTDNSQTKKADNMKDKLRKQQQRNNMNDIEKRNALQKDRNVPE